MSALSLENAFAGAKDLIGGGDSMWSKGSGSDGGIGDLLKRAAGGALSGGADALTGGGGTLSSVAESMFGGKGGLSAANSNDSPFSAYSE